MSKKLLPALAILLLVLVALSFQKSFLEKRPDYSEVKPEVIMITSFPQTEHWKSYTNKDLGYSLKYPESWKLEVSDKGNPSFTFKEYIINVYTDETPFEQYIKFAQSGTYKSEDINLNGIIGKRTYFKDKIQDGSDAYSERVMLPGKKLTLVLDAWLASHDQEKIKEISSWFEQISSTFKFEH